MSEGRTPDPDADSYRLLILARRILRKRGLSKLRHIASDGSCCLFGAVELARAELGLPHEPTGVNCGAALVDECQRRRLGRPDAFNDRPETTLEEALEVLDGAAALVVA